MNRMSKTYNRWIPFPELISMSLAAELGISLRSPPSSIETKNHIIGYWSWVRSIGKSEISINNATNSTYITFIQS
jgi:hypothetical protein